MILDVKSFDGRIECVCKTTLPETLYETLCNIFRTEYLYHETEFIFIIFSYLLGLFVYIITGNTISISFPLVIRLIFV